MKNMQSIKFPATEDANHNIYAHLWLDHYRVTDRYKCDLYVRIIQDLGEILEVEEVREVGESDNIFFYIDKAVIAMARIEK